jgi:hypothetical protein
MRWSWLRLCSVAADLSVCPSRMCRWYSLILVSIDRPVCPMYTWPHSQRRLYTTGVHSPRSSFTGRRKLEIFLGGMHTFLMLCLASILLRRPHVVWTYGSTLSAVITATDYHPRAPSRIESTSQVAGFLSCLLGFLIREDGADKLSRNVVKRLPHDEA